MLENKGTSRWTIPINVETVFVFYVFVTYVCAVHVAIFEPFKAVCDYVSLFFILIMFWLSRKISFCSITFFVVSAAIYFACIYVNTGGIGSVVTILMPFLLVFSLSRTSLTPKTKNILAAFAVCFLLFAFVRSWVYRADWLYHRFHDVNPNTMGMYVMYSFIILLVFLDPRRRRNKRIVFVFFTISAISMVNYESRMCLIIMLLTFILSAFSGKISNRILLLIVFAFTAVGTAFPFVYTMLYNNNVELTFLNKSLYTGREQIWSDMFSRFGSDGAKWLLGMGSHYAGEGINIHNNFFAMIVNFGILGFFLYFGYFFAKLKKVLSFQISDETKRCVIAFSTTVLALGCTEVTSLWAVTYPFAYMFFSQALGSLRNVYTAVKAETRPNTPLI